MLPRLSKNVDPSTGSSTEPPFVVDLGSQPIPVSTCAFASRSRFDQLPYEDFPRLSTDVSTLGETGPPTTLRWAEHRCSQSAFAAHAFHVLVERATSAAVTVERDLARRKGSPRAKETGRNPERLDRSQPATSLSLI